MTYRATDPDALAVRRDALERASRFLDQGGGYSAALHKSAGPKPPPTVGDLTSAADAILAWLIQPLPGDPMAEPEPAQQSTNPQAEPRFRDLSNIVRHTGPNGVWHAGPYQTCPICQIGHNALPGDPVAANVVYRQGEGIQQINSVIPPAYGCSPLAQAQHTEATNRAVAAIDKAITEVGTWADTVPSTSADAPKSAGPNTPIPQGGTSCLTLLPSARDHEETGLSSSYKRPY